MKYSTGDIPGSLTGVTSPRKSNGMHRRSNEFKDLSDQYHEGRHSILVKEIENGKFVIDTIDCADSQRAKVDFLETAKKMNFPLSLAELEVFRSAHKFKSVTILDTQAPTDKPQNIY